MLHLRKFSASGQTSWHRHQPTFFVRALINSPTNAHPEEDGQNGIVEFRKKTLKGKTFGVFFCYHRAKNLVK